jgi:hypothetical protein
MYRNIGTERYPRNVVDPDPHSFWSAGSGSGCMRAKMTHEREEISSFEVLDVLF